MGFESRGFTFERIGPLKQTWGGAEIQSKTLVIKHNGVELGEACYLFSAACNNRPGLVISDIGFGWERIAASALAEDSHSCVPGRSNIDHRLPLTIQDSLRAAALIIGSGIQPSSKAQGYRVRSLVRHIVQENFAKGSDLTGSLDAFYGGWSTWAKMRLGPNATREIFQKEELRAITHHVALHLFGEHDSHNIAKTTEAFRAELSEVLSRGRRESPRKIAQLIEASGGRYRTLLEEV